MTCQTSLTPYSPLPKLKISYSFPLLSQRENRHIHRIYFLYFLPLIIRKNKTYRMHKVKVSVKEKQHVNSSTGTRFFCFFCHLYPLSSFETKITPNTSKAMCLTEKQPLLLFFFSL